MTPRQAIAAMRALHKGGYHARARWVTRSDPGALRAPEREALRQELRAIREQNGGDYPRPKSKELVAKIDLAHRYPCVILRNEGWLVWEGCGDTWEEAVQYARNARRVGLKPHS